MNQFFARLLSIRIFRGQSTTTKQKNARAFTIEMTPLTDESAQWASKYWNTDEGGIFYIRACYAPSSAIPNDGMALRYMERHLTEFRSGRLRFELKIARPEQTPTLVDDMVQEFPPSILITRRNIVRISQDDGTNDGIDLLNELGMSA